MVDGFQSSLEFELAGLTVDTDASPVVEPVGEVTGLLDLGQDNPFAYGVDCSGGHNDTLAGPDLEAVHAGIDFAGLQGRGQLLGSGPRVTADPQSAAGLVGEDVPGCGLAALPGVMSCGGGIVGVNLQREAVCRVKKLDQQRERIQRGVPSQQFVAAFGDQPLQCPSVEGAAGDDALVVFQVDDFPALAAIVEVTGRLVEFRREVGAAPDGSSQQGTEVQRAERRGRHGVTAHPSASCATASDDDG